MFVVDVKESQTTTAEWADKMGHTFPVLLDADGTVSASCAPEGLLPDLARDQVPIASNLIID